MTFEAVAAALQQTVITLFNAGPTGILAISTMALLFIISCFGLRRAAADLRSEESALDSIVDMQLLKHFSVSEPEVPQESESNTFALGRLGASGATPSPDIDFDDETHARHVYELVIRHSRLASPNSEAVAAVVRNYSPIGLERQRATANIILLVGLAGTVFGLAAAIGEVRLGASSGLDPASLPEQVMFAFEGVLAELPTAFVSTIWGILLALAYGPIGTRIELRAARYVDRLEQEALGVWIPHYWPEALAAQVDDLRKAMAQTQRTVQLAGDVMRTSTSGLSEILRSATTDMGNHVNNLSAITSESRQLLEELSAEVNSAAQTLHSGTTQVHESVERLQGYHVEVTEAYSRMQDLLSEAQTSNSNQISGALAASDEQHRLFASTASDLLVQIGSLAETMRSSIEMAERQREELPNSLEAVGDRLGHVVSESLGRAVLDSVRAAVGSGRISGSDEAPAASAKAGAAGAATGKRPSGDYAERYAAADGTQDLDPFAAFAPEPMRSPADYGNQDSD